MRKLGGNQETEQPTQFGRLRSLADLPTVAEEPVIKILDIDRKKVFINPFVSELQAAGEKPTTAITLREMTTEINRLLSQHSTIKKKEVKKILKNYGYFLAQETFSCPVTDSHYKQAYRVVDIAGKECGVLHI